MPYIINPSHPPQSHSSWKERGSKWRTGRRWWMYVTVGNKSTGVWKKFDTEDKDPRKTQLFFVHDKVGEGKFSDIKVAGSVFHRNFSFRKGWALGPSYGVAKNSLLKVDPPAPSFVFWDVRLWEKRPSKTWSTKHELCLKVGQQNSGPTLRTNFNHKSW